MKKTLLLVFGMLVISGSATAQDSLHIRQIGLYDKYWDRAKEVIVDGTTAFVADGIAGLRILDVSDPSTMSEIGNIPTTSSIYGVATSNNLLFAADAEKGLRIFDISDLQSITDVGRLHTSGFVYGIALNGNYVYLANRTAGLIVVDVSSPSSPQDVGSIETPGTCEAVAVRDDYAYIADGEEGFRVIDISNPSQPEETGSIQTPGKAVDIDIQDEYAFIADESGGLRVIDISDPLSPTEVGDYQSQISIVSVDVSGFFVYVSDLFYGLRILEVSNPQFPGEIANYEYSNTSRYSALVLSDNMVYMGIDYSLGAIDVSDPLHPELDDIHVSSGNVRGVAVAGDYAFVTVGHDGLDAMNIINPENLEVVGNADTPGQAWDVEISGDYAYVTNFDHGLRAFDISNPSSPQPAGFVETPDFSEGLALQGDYVYLCDGESGLWVIDISTPSSPAAAGIYDTPGFAGNVAVQGDYAYVADSYEGLRIVNVSTPGNPVEVGHYDTEYVIDVAVSGNTAYIISERGIQSLDITVPNTPSEISVLDELRTPTQFTIVNDFLFVSANLFYILDVSDPSNMEIAGYYNTPGNANQVDVVGTTAYVAEYTYLGIYDCSWAMGVSDRKTPEIARSVKLHPCYPNPFNPTTTLSFDLPVASETTLSVFNMLGQSVYTVDFGRLNAGHHAHLFDAHWLPSGVYFSRLHAGSVMQSSKMVLTK